MTILICEMCGPDTPCKLDTGPDPETEIVMGNNMPDKCPFHKAGPDLSEWKIMKQEYQIIYCKECEFKEINAGMKNKCPDCGKHLYVKRG